MPHIPVLLNEVIKFLEPAPGKFIIDGTVDGGGHAVSILEKMRPQGIFLAIDWDKDLLRISEKRIAAELKISPPAGGGKLKIILLNDNYANIPEMLKAKKLGKADGLLLDLGFSSEQLENSGRGFSYRKDEPLLMTFNPEQEGITAEKVVNRFNEKELADIIFRFGEERYSRRIARNIVEERKREPIKTTFRLAEIIKKSVPGNYERGRLHPAVRTFQALRIFVNQELENLERVLDSLPQILTSGGRAVIISFHSLEDRLAKNKFKEMQRAGLAEILTKKPVRPSEEEVEKNPRAHSAKLRACSMIKSA